MCVHIASSELARRNNDKTNKQKYKIIEQKKKCSHTSRNMWSSVRVPWLLKSLVLGRNISSLPCNVKPRIDEGSIKMAKNVRTHCICTAVLAAGLEFLITKICQIETKERQKALKAHKNFTPTTGQLGGPAVFSFSSLSVTSFCGWKWVKWGDQKCRILSESSQGQNSVAISTNDTGRYATINFFLCCCFDFFCIGVFVNGFLFVCCSDVHCLFHWRKTNWLTRFFGPRTQQCLCLSMRAIPVCHPWGRSF